MTDTNLDLALSAIFRPDRRTFPMQRRLYLKFLDAGYTYEQLVNMTGTLNRWNSTYDPRFSNSPADIAMFFSTVFGTIYTREEMSQMNIAMLMNSLGMRGVPITDELRRMDKKSLEVALDQRQEAVHRATKEFMRRLMRKKSRAAKPGFCQVTGEERGIDMRDPIFNERTVSQCHKIYFDPKLDLTDEQREEKYNRCLLSFGCLEKQLPLYMRPYSREYFKELEAKNELPCCVANPKARLKGLIRLERIKDELGVVPFANAKKALEASNMDPAVIEATLADMQANEQRLNQILSGESDNGVLFIQDFVKSMKKSLGLWIDDADNGPEEQDGAFEQGVYDTVAGAATTVKNAVAPTLSYLTNKIGVPLYKLHRWIKKNQTLILILSIIAKTIKTAICRWISIKLGYFTYESDKIDWSVEGVMKRVKVIMPSMLTVQTFAIAAVSSALEGGAFEAVFRGAKNTISSSLALIGMGGAAMLGPLGAVLVPVGIYGAAFFGMFATPLEQLAKEFCTVWVTQKAMKLTSSQFMELLTSPCRQMQVLKRPPVITGPIDHTNITRVVNDRGEMAAPIVQERYDDDKKLEDNSWFGGLLNPNREFEKIDIEKKRAKEQEEAANRAAPLENYIEQI